MKNMKMWLVSFLVAGAALVLFLDGQKGTSSDPLVGKGLLKSAELASIDEIFIKDANESVRVKKVEGGLWILPEESKFPVDAKEVARFFDGLGKLKVYSVAAKTDKNKSKFGLDESAKSFQLKSSGKSVLQLSLGEDRSGGGQFAMIDPHKKVYLLDANPPSHASSNRWELKSFMDIEDASVKSVSLLVDGKSRVKVERSKKEDSLKLTTTPKGKVAKDGAVQSLASILRSFSYRKRHDLSNEEAKTALSTAKRYADITLFDGRTVSVSLGKIKSGDQDKYFVQVKTGLGKGELTPEQKSQMQLVDQMMSLAHFEVGSYTYNKFVKKESDLLDKAVSKKASPKKKG